NHDQRLYQPAPAAASEGERQAMTNVTYAWRAVRWRAAWFSLAVRPKPHGGAKLRRSLAVLVLTLLAFTITPHASAEEIYFQDGKRLMAMIEAVSADGKITLRLPSGRLQ